MWPELRDVALSQSLPPRVPSMDKIRKALKLVCLSQGPRWSFPFPSGQRLWGGQHEAVKVEEPHKFPPVLIHQGIVHKPQPDNFRVLVSTAGCVFLFGM